MIDVDVDADGAVEVVEVPAELAEDVVVDDETVADAGVHDGDAESGEDGGDGDVAPVVDDDSNGRTQDDEDAQAYRREIVEDNRSDEEKEATFLQVPCAVVSGRPGAAR